MATQLNKKPANLSPVVGISCGGMHGTHLKNATLEIDLSS